MGRDRHKAELGDFQTPPELSARLCQLLVKLGQKPRVVVEPTCGTGSFVIAAAQAFGQSRIVGIDLNPTHLQAAATAAKQAKVARRVELRQGNVFELPWDAVLRDLPEPLLVIGNPPWVTSAQMARINGSNLPPKSNLKRLRGYDAISGQSNFDISEWLLLRFLLLLQGRQATVAMLCKTNVARRVTEHAAREGCDFKCSGLWTIEAKQHFAAAVKACFFVFHTGAAQGRLDPCCPVYSSLAAARSEGMLGVRNGRVVSNVTAYDRVAAQLVGKDDLEWRSGVKHDCARVMVLEATTKGFRNGLGQTVDLEPTCLYPLLKSSDLAKGRGDPGMRWLVLPQRRVGEATDPIRQAAPKTWAYLEQHRHLLEARKSSIYSRQPAFSVFGVGPYSFAPFKVAVSGLHKGLAFVLVTPKHGRAVVLDDTCYFLGFDDVRLARAAQALLQSRTATDFFDALVFWDEKRPLTKRVLDQLHLGRLARAVSRAEPRALADVAPEWLELLMGVEPTGSDRLQG